MIHVKDVNDNAPRFDRESYEWVLPENSPDFPIPFFVYADDEDENGTENAEVSCCYKLYNEFQILRSLLASQLF